MRKNNDRLDALNMALYSLQFMQPPVKDGPPDLCHWLWLKCFNRWSRTNSGTRKEKFWLFMMKQFKAYPGGYYEEIERRKVRRMQAIRGVQTVAKVMIKALNSFGASCAALVSAIKAAKFHDEERAREIFKHGTVDGFSKRHVFEYKTHNVNKWNLRP